MTTATYEEFLSAKTHWVQAGEAVEPAALSDRLYPFQRYLTAWALTMKRAALLADCGLGKTPMELFWAEYVARVTGKPVLIGTPLAVSFQMERDAEYFGVEAGVSRSGKPVAAVTITNYEQSQHFDPDDFAGMACDESSILKSFDGVTRAMITDFMRHLAWRLLGTATAAPNDYVELGTSSEALGWLGAMDMLARFFTNDQHTVRHNAHGLWRKVNEWRFKGHAEAAFWQWVSSWARALRRPSDLGFSDVGFDRPPVVVRQHIVEAPTETNGTLFAMPAAGLQEERKEQRQTLVQRCEKAAELLADAEPGIAWCHLNDEGDLLTKLIDGAVQVKGSDAVEAKEEALLAFTRGEIRVLVTKPSIGGWGLNWQHCHRMTYFPSHSYEEYYQALHRCDRYGQQHSVEVDLVTTPGGANALEHASIEGTVLEPCAADGRIASVLRESDRREVYTNDVDGRFGCDYAYDALHPGMWEAVSREAGGKIDWVVTNPPFSCADQLVPLAFRESRIGAAMLLRLSWLEPTQARGRFLAEHPPRMISIPRISFTGDGKTDNVPCVWFVWEHGHQVRDVTVVPRRASSQLLLEGAL